MHKFQSCDISSLVFKFSFIASQKFSWSPFGIPNSINSFFMKLIGISLNTFDDIEFKRFKSNFVGADPNEFISKKLATSFRECNNFGELEDPKVDIKLFNAIGSTPEFLKSLIDNEPSLFDRLSPDKSTSKE